MRFIEKIRLEVKIAVIVIIATLSVVITVIVNYNAVSTNSERLNELESHIYPILLLANKNAFLIEKIEDLYVQAITTRDSDPVDEAKITFDLLMSNLKKIVNLHISDVNSITSIEKNLIIYQKVNTEIYSIFQFDDPDFESLGEKIAVKDESYEFLTKAIKQFQTSIDKEFSTLILKSKVAGNESVIKILTIGGILLGLILIFALIMIKSIIATIRQTANSFLMLATGKGDLEFQLPIAVNDDLGKLARHFNEFLTVLKMLISDVKQVATPLGGLGQTLKSQMQEVSNMNSSQASDAENFQLTMGKLNTSIDDISKSISEAHSASDSAEAQVKKGANVLELSIETSSQLDADINEASIVVSQLAAGANQMNSILDVIVGIAEQTNLLALNAAIEAARAGESGRGFAVVADEVRTLASRSAKTSIEIRTILDSLVEAASNSVHSMNQAKEQSSTNKLHSESAGQSLKDISVQILNINERNKDIRYAAEAQGLMVKEAKNQAELMFKSIMDAKKIVNDMNNVTISMANFSSSLIKTTSKFKMAEPDQEMF